MLHQYRPIFLCLLHFDPSKPQWLSITSVFAIGEHQGSVAFEAFSGSYNEAGLKHRRRAVGCLRHHCARSFVTFADSRPRLCYHGVKTITTTMHVAAFLQQSWQWSFAYIVEALIFMLKTSLALCPDSTAMRLLLSGSSLWCFTRPLRPNAITQRPHASCFRAFVTR